MQEARWEHLNVEEVEHVLHVSRLHACPHALHPVHHTALCTTHPCPVCCMWRHAPCESTQVASAPNLMIVSPLGNFMMGCIQGPKEGAYDVGVKGI